MYLVKKRNATISDVECRFSHALDSEAVESKELRSKEI
jgi:hypothetical protein